MPREESQPFHRTRWLAVGACLAGAALAFDTGLIWLFPLIPTVIIWLSGKNLLSARRHPFVPAVSLQLGQLIWYVSASIYMRLLAPADILEAAALIGLSVWLVVKPSLVPALVVAIAQVLALVFNLVALSDLAVDSIQHKALTVTIVWRLGTLLLLWEGYALLRQSPSTKAAEAAA